MRISEAKLQIVSEAMDRLAQWAYYYYYSVINSMDVAVILPF
jgi:hypothetical protein